MKKIILVPAFLSLSAFAHLIDVKKDIQQFEFHSTPYLKCELQFKYISRNYGEIANYEMTTSPKESIFVIIPSEQEMDLSDYVLFQSDCGLNKNAQKKNGSLQMKVVTTSQTVEVPAHFYYFMDGLDCTREFNCTSENRTILSIDMVNFISEK